MSKPLPDLCFVERRTNIRIIVSIPGRFNLASKRDVNGQRREFACRVVNMGTDAMALVAPVSGPVGERVVTYIPRFGQLEGRITRLFERGFVMSLNGDDDFRQKMAAKLDWLEKNKNHDLPEGRRHMRIVPRNPWSILTLPGGQKMSCLVIDMSVSGAAVSADLEIKAGTRVLVGKVPGRVVRHFGEGFAIQFDEVQSPATLEQYIVTS